MGALTAPMRRLSIDNVFRNPLPPSGVFPPARVWPCLLRALLLAMILGPASAAASSTTAWSAPGDPRAGGPFVGVWTSGVSATEAANLHEIGVGWARVTVVWADIEPSEGSFEWTALDQTMAQAAGDGGRSVLALVRNNPVWAASSRCSLGTDLERQRMATFLGALATRYPYVVWELYNEMDNTSPAFDAQNDLGGCFATLGADGTPSDPGRIQYALAIEAAATALHAADPGAQLAAGGVASGNFTGDRGIFDRAFLPGVLARLKRDASLSSLDYVTVHYYSSQSPSYATTGRDLLGRIGQLRADLMAAGLGEDELKPVMSDELGYTSGSGTSTSDPTNSFNLGQAAYVPKLLSRAAALNVRAGFWFLLQDTPGGLASDNAYGLLDRTGAAKPSYLAMRYFLSLVRRTDQFVAVLDLKTQAPTLEGYSFTLSDGRSLQVVWNETDFPAAPLTYTSDCKIDMVTDLGGTATPVDRAANAVMVGSEPRYIFCATAA